MLTCTVPGAPGSHVAGGEKERRPTICAPVAVVKTVPETT
jgi:hypothetical protein